MLAPGTRRALPINMDTQAQNIIVKCKCPGVLGTAHMRSSWSENNSGTEFYSKAFSWSPWMVCQLCNHRFKSVVVTGRKSTKHECNAKCLASKGPSCECSCAGRNHGKSYA